MTASVLILLVISLLLTLAVLVLISRDPPAKPTEDKPRSLADLECYGGPLDGAELHVMTDHEYTLLVYRNHMYESVEPIDALPGRSLTMRHAGKVAM